MRARRQAGGESAVGATYPRIARKSHPNSASPWAARRRAIAECAARQFGVISRSQLREIGLGDDAIDREVRMARLHRVFRGVYAYGNPSVGERGRLWAAVLACGPETVVSHRSAAALMGLLDRGPVVIDVIAPASSGRAIEGIRPHKVRSPRGTEAGTFDGIPCTSPSRVFVDLAGTVGLPTLRSCFERAAAKGVLDLDEIEAVLARGPRRGAKTLRALIAQWRPAEPVARRGRLKSPLEAKVLPVVLRDGAPEPRVNAPVELADSRWIEVDLLWEAECFVVEADSRDFHGTDAAFERDRWRDRELMRVGYSTLRITNLAAEHETDAVADTIRQRLGLGTDAAS